MITFRIVIMKKITLLALAALLGLPGFAQTNFRNLTFDEAVAAAKAENKLVFMDFYTDWCGPCKEMMRSVFPQKSVGDFMNAHFVCIKLNAEKEGKELAKQYKVKGYPTFVAVDTQKNVVLTKVGMAPADLFVSEIERMLDPDRTPERMEERYESGERTSKLIASYAAYLTETAYGQRGNRANGEKADKIVLDYFQGLTDAQRLLPENLFIYTGYARSTADEITRFMAAHRNEFDASAKPQVEQKLANLYRNEISDLLCGKAAYEADAYAALKQQTNDLGFNSDKQYDPCFNLIESHARGDMEAYLTLCKQEYPKMTVELQGILLSNFAALFEGQSEDIRMKAARFLRDLLPDMPAKEMAFVPYQIILLEGVSLD